MGLDNESRLYSEGIGQIRVISNIDGANGDECNVGGGKAVWLDRCKRGSFVRVEGTGRTVLHTESCNHCNRATTITMEPCNTFPTVEREV